MSNSKKEELGFDLSETESKEQQTKPDNREVAIQISQECQEVAVQTSPDCQEVAVQTHGRPTAVKTTGKSITFNDM